MIILNKKKIIDVALLTEEEIFMLREPLFYIYPKVFIPEHIVSNKEKMIYKVGYLNELFLKVFPEQLKKDIFSIVIKRFDIFVEKRQYYNLVNEYHSEKYSHYIKNK
jgi:hypothetical protein